MITLGAAAASSFAQSPAGFLAGAGALVIPVLLAFGFGRLGSKMDQDSERTKDDRSRLRAVEDAVLELRAIVRQHMDSHSS